MILVPNKKVLIITYYWPPAGGPGVQRVLKFAKYLPEFGWQPVILTVKKGEFPAIDKTLEKDIPKDCIVYQTNSWEPTDLYKNFTGKKKDEKIPVAVLSEKNLNWKKRITNWIRLNLFIPDAKIGWIPFAVRQGKKIIRKHQPDIIFSSSPPPTVHLIAKKLAKWSGIKWVADFRDPWTEIHYYEDNPRAYFPRSLDKQLEYSVLSRANIVTCISQKDIELDFGHKTSIQKCINIPNGYDETDFVNFNVDSNQKFNIFQIIHLGSINHERLPISLLSSIEKLYLNKIISPQSFKITLIGKTENILKEYIVQHQIEDLVEFIPYLPHKEALTLCQSADLLLLLVTQSNKNIRILPGKTFEYLRMGKQILALGPKGGEVARILRETNSGKMMDYDSEGEIYKFLESNITRKRASHQLVLKNIDKIKKYSRKELTHSLVHLFEDIIS